MSEQEQIEICALTAALWYARAQLKPRSTSVELKRDWHAYCTSLDFNVNFFLTPLDQL